MTRRYRVFWALHTLFLTALLFGGCQLPPAPTAPAATPRVAGPVAVLPSPTASNTPSPAPVDIPTKEPTPTPTETPALEQAPALPEHRLGVRFVDGVGEFYDRLSGEKFVPRGYNYVRAAPMSTRNLNLWHSTFNPGFYEPDRTEVGLQAMHDAGYNAVRVFVDCCREGNNVGNPAGGISETYLQNVVDFLNKAQAYQVYVLLILDLTPAQGGYDEMWRHCCETFDGENLRYLTVGGHQGERRFNQDFIRALIEAGAPMETIFAYDLTNEVHFTPDKAPLNFTSGRVRTANGHTYDMASPEDKQRMMDENLVFWIDRQRAAILDVDPTALVTVSFPAINLGQTTVNPGAAIRESTADFIDLHTYLGWGLSLEQYLNQFGVAEPPEKPVILGEFGAAKRPYPSAAAAAQDLKEWQVASCAYGFDGWLLWTWDTDEQPDLWNGLSDNGAINAALAPTDRPDPCSPGNADH